MTDLIQEQLFQAQDRYDELEERLKGLPAFRRYLELGFLKNGQEPEAALSDNPDFQEWLAIAATINELHKANDKPPSGPRL
jgi:hypothetical protein